MRNRIQKRVKTAALIPDGGGLFRETTVNITHDTGKVRNEFKVFWVLNEESWMTLLSCYNGEEVKRILSLLPMVKDHTYVLRRDDHNPMHLVDLEGHFALSRNIWAKFIKKLLHNNIIKIIIEGGLVSNSVSYRIVINPYLMNRGPVSDNVIMQFQDISKGLPEVPIPKDVRNLAKKLFDPLLR